MRKPTTQVVVDCNGAKASIGLLQYLVSCISVLRGVEYIAHPFWVTRPDLKALLQYETVLPSRFHVDSEARHEPSFDLYNDGGTVPIGRLVNVYIPDLSEGGADAKFL